MSRVNVVVPIFGRASAMERERCAGVLELLRRVERAQGEETADGVRGREAGPALLELGARGRLSFAEADGAVEVLYVPSRAALLSVLEARPGAASFPEPVQKKQADALRTSQGALFRFPVEGDDGPPLEVFITDWSPCPAAAAVAIHRHHPFAADLDKPQGSFFTGRFVRHPLSGDLLPVWVADWVRPDFGTGAVLVNPAHDATDLEFGRAVGLPIRFALAPAGFDGRPGTWPSPPVIRTGRSIKTGFWDGLPPEEAMQRYFEVLERDGLAERYRDVQAGRWRIAWLVQDAAGDLAWSGSKARLAGEGEGGARVRLEEAGLLEAALALGAGSAATLIAPAAEQADALLLLRLLAFDLHGAPLAPRRVLLVQKVQEAKIEAPSEVQRLAVLVAAPLSQVAVLKQQSIEQAQRFLRVHGELCRAWDPAVEGEAAEVPRPLRQAKTALLEGDPARAFTALAPFQKQLGAAPAAPALAGYLAVAHVMAGLEIPSGFDVPDVWSHL